MEVELMNDGNNAIKIVYEKGTIAQIQVSKSDEWGFDEEVYFNLSRKEAIQVIKGLQNYVDGK